MGYLDAQAGDADRTAFRKAEKRYKFYKHSSTSARSAKHRDAVPPTDLSDVLDFREMKRLGVPTKNGITSVDGEFDWPIFIMEKHPGFYFIPEALDLKEQMHWIRESLLYFPQPPNRTNHTAIYGLISDLWRRAQNKEVFEQMDGMSGLVARSSDQPDASRSCSNEIFDTTQPNGNALSRDAYDPYADRCPQSNQISRGLQKFIPMKSLLQKLRWATLGLQFDWSKRAYDLSLPYNGIPQELSDLASKLARPAMNSSQFRAEAAIVNYFGYDDMLGGHLDDMEADWSKPIVSISLGCKAIFLLGGPSREDSPTAMFLRSGDVVLMTGPARGCFHGVPRIFTDPKDSDVPEFFSHEPSCAPFLDYVKTSRINLNIRQVF